MTDYSISDTIYKMFTTRAFATGVPTVLSGTPIVSAYENDSAVQITAGITLGVSHDSVVGMNLLTIVATTGNGFEAGKDYNLAITAGTVGGVSVVGEVVATFSIERDASVSDIAALNNISTAQVNTECDTALADYDPPTNTEMIARTLLAADYFDPAADAVANVTLVGTTTTNTDMRGTDSAALATALATAQTDLDTITGSDGVTLATAQGLYAPSKAGDSMDMLSISGDTIAADNLEATYDGTGYTDDYAPAQQQQVANISSGGSGGANFTNSQDNVDGAIKGVTFVGVETSGTNADVNSGDGVYQIIDDTGNNIDIVYEFDVTGGKTASVILFKGRVNGNNDEVQVSAYNGSTWDNVWLFDGQNSGNTTDIQQQIPLLSSHTGTGTDIGKVYIRLTATAQTNPTLSIDMLLVQAVNIGQTVGYTDGAIWVDTVNGVSGTESFVNGTGDNPVLTWANALTLSTSTNLKRFRITNGSSIQLTANSDNYTILGSGYEIDLNGQSIANTYISGASDISGVSSGANFKFDDCLFGSTITMAAGWSSNCRLNGTMTLTGTGGFFFQSCFSTTGTSPIIDLGAANAGQTVCLTPLTGGIEFHNMRASDLVHVEGAGEITLNVNCTAGDLEYAGAFTVTDNSATVTVNKDSNTSNIASILEDTGTTLNGKIDDIQGATFSTSTDSLEAIRDRGDAAWVTGAGGSSPTVAQIADGVWDEVLSGHVTVGTTGAAITDIETDVTAILADTADMQPKLGTPATDVSADIAAVKVDTAAVLVDTDTTIPALISGLNDISTTQVQAELVTYGANKTAPDNASITAIKAKTDSLTFTSGTDLDANIQKVNDVTVTGTGASGNEWGP